MNKKISGFMLATMLLAAVRLAEAQQPKVYRVGVLIPGEAWYEIVDGLRVGLRQLGLEEGKQFIFAIRDWKGDVKVAQEAARNLEQEKINLIYATSTNSTLAAKQSTADIPIVSVPAPTRLLSASWRASQNRGPDLQVCTSRAPIPPRNVWRT